MAGRSSPAVPTYPALRPTPCTARSTLSVHVPRYAFRKFSAIADAFSGLIRWLGESSASAWSKRFTSQTVLSGTAFELPDARMLTPWGVNRSEEHTSELQSLRHLVCRLLLEKKTENNYIYVLYINNQIFSVSFLLIYNFHQNIYIFLFFFFFFFLFLCFLI